MPNYKKYKRPPVKFTSRDFESIKRDLINYAKIYYPETYKDFNEASFGSMLFDMVAYVGDMLSFYVDYQANESFLDSALELKNVVSIAKQLGFKYPGSSSSTGQAALYVEVPAQDDAAGSEPDVSQLPILKRGSILTSDGGATFVLNEDVDFSAEGVQVVVGTDDGKKPTSYAYKAYGEVVSGKLETEAVTIGNYEKFKMVSLEGENISEIVEVIDSAGHQYFEVDYLSQNIIYESIRNVKRAAQEDAPYVLRPRLVPRRYVVEHSPENNTIIRFGYGSEKTLEQDEFPEPSAAVMNKHAKKYFKDKMFDPNILLETDKFGIVPPPGEMRVTYRRNTADDVNIPTNSLKNIAGPILSFRTTDVSPAVRNKVLSTLEANNEEPIIGQIKSLQSEDVRTLAADIFASQNRAVTRNDYISIINRMPANFGAIKRSNVVQDKDSFKRNLNIYVVSENSDGFLASTPLTVKKNLKTWLNRYKMINDTIDILDGKITNIGIEFELIGVLGANKTEILNKAIETLQENYLNKFFFGTPFYLSDIYKLLNDLPEVVDTKIVRMVDKRGAGYSENNYNAEENISSDGRVVYVPEDTVLEIRYPEKDIAGVVT